MSEPGNFWFGQERVLFHVVEGICVQTDFFGDIDL